MLVAGGREGGMVTVYTVQGTVSIHHTCSKGSRTPPLSSRAWS